MTVRQFIKNLLENNWTASASGRPNDVPQPEIVLEKTQVQNRLRNSDTIHVVTGGPESFDFQGFGAAAERADRLVTCDIRTAKRGDTPGLIRMVGERDANNDRPRWGGLIGETRRIINTKRRGHKEFDRIHAEEATPVLEDGGKNYYRAAVQVRLEEYGAEIDTST